jgi:ABC-type antimicrobial peptide transport system permease subunit
MVGVILLCAVAGAVVLTVTAGARRSATSLDRLAEATGAADLLLDVSGADSNALDSVKASPVVAGAGEMSIVFAMIDGVEEDVGLFIPHDHLIGAVEHDRVLRGRLTDVDAVDEVTLNEHAAEVLDADVGDAITIHTLTPEQVDAEDYFPPRGPDLHMRVVGITRGPDDLVANGEGRIRSSPALLQAVTGKVDIFATYVGVRLRPGASVADFERSLGGTVPTGIRSAALTFDTRTKPVHDAVSTIADGLTVFAIVAAIASAVVVGLAVGRHLGGATADQEVLVALGMSPAARFTGLVLLAMPIAVGGAALAVAGAIIASPSMPIGLARKVEPDPGFAVDWWVVVIGFAAVALIVTASAAFSAWRIVRSSLVPALTTAPSRPRAAAVHAGAGPTVATGVELAFDRHRPSIPSRSAIAGVTVAVAAVIAILTFSSSLDRLLGASARWGYPWQLTLNFTSDDVDAAAAELADDARFEDVARWDAGFSEVGGAPVRAWGLTTLRGEVGYTLRSGRQPVGADEAVLGPTTAERLRVGIGDTVSVAVDPAVPAASAHVVGIALFPELEDGSLTDGIGYVGSAFRANATMPDLFEGSQIVVTGAPGTDLDELVAQLDEQYAEAVSGETIPTAPGGVGNLTQIRTLPRAIAIFVVVLGLASLAHALATTVGRRRRELATLRSIGLTPRQTTACVVWQAVTITAFALMLGIPLGLILGRGAWWATADPIGVATDVDRPIGALALVCLGTIVAGVVIAGAVAWSSGRTSPAAALRAE